jgi:hypothetical protein
LLSRVKNHGGLLHLLPRFNQHSWWLLIVNHIFISVFPFLFLLHYLILNSYKFILLGLSGLWRLWLWKCFKMPSRVFIQISYNARNLSLEHEELVLYKDMVRTILSPGWIQNQSVPAAESLRSSCYIVSSCSFPAGVPFFWDVLELSV